MTLRWLLLLAISFSPLQCDGQCRGCDLALASYYVTSGQNLTAIAKLFNIDLTGIDTTILPHNKDIISKDSIQANTRINIPFQCDCINGEFLGRKFRYNVNFRDTYTTIAADVYHNLTTVELLQQTNTYDPSRIPDNVGINATVKCFCGDAGVSRDYGLFLTYPLRSGDTLESVAREVGLSDLSLLQRYNPAVDFSAGEGIVFVPHNDTNGSFRPLEKSAAGLSPGAIAGISLAVIAVLVFCLLVWIYCKASKRKGGILLSGTGSASASNEAYHQRIQMNSPFPHVVADNALEYSYEELAKATDNFNLAKKIGEGGFGSVYYAEINGEKAAIKKMDMQATKAFLAELNVLARVHHVNLVRLMGYCTEGSLFLVYEFMENGNLSEHLRSSSGKQLPWSTRLKIALDSARGLEYIHDHTVQLYIHRDIKSANILLDKDLRAKVADFGLAKLTGGGDLSIQSKRAGTFGYIAPEYGGWGELSPKVDVYAFGVVLYELISGKPAIVKSNDVGRRPRGLIDLFEDVFSEPDQKTELLKIVDPNLGGDYPVDSVYQMAQLARVCTQEDADKRPDMREVVVALMTLISSTAGWDAGALFGNPAMLNLMSGR